MTTKTARGAGKSGTNPFRPPARRGNLSRIGRLCSPCRATVPKKPGASRRRIHRVATCLGIFGFARISFAETLRSASNGSTGGCVILPVGVIQSMCSNRRSRRGRIRRRRCGRGALRLWHLRCFRLGLRPSGYDRFPLGEPSSSVTNCGDRSTQARGLDFVLATLKAGPERVQGVTRLRIALRRRPHSHLERTRQDQESEGCQEGIR